MKEVTIKIEDDLSRVCGDDPTRFYYFDFRRMICPAYAGIILYQNVQGNTREDLFRVCGDDPAEIARLNLSI